MVGTQVLTNADARDAARGDTVHSSIAVVAIPSAAPGTPVDYMLLGNVASYKNQHLDASFLMRDTEGRIDRDEGHTQVTYRVVDRSDAGQTIETEYRDGDRAAWGRYRATRNDVTPLASRLFSEHYMYGAIPYALVFALAICVAASFVRRRMRRATAGAQSSH